MISLDDHRWSELEHAYGAASDIPELLRALAASPGPTASCGEEPWFSLWSSLCHQGDVYTASYVAVTHIVRIAGRAKTPIHFSFFLLPAAVEVARRTGHGPGVPAEFTDDYHRAIECLMENVSIHRNEPWDQDMLLSAAAAGSRKRTYRCRRGTLEPGCRLDRQNQRRHVRIAKGYRPRPAN